MNTSGDDTIDSSGIIGRCSIGLHARASIELSAKVMAAMSNLLDTSVPFCRSRIRKWVALFAGPSHRSDARSTAR
jgi:hypothetical protein